MRQKKEPLVKLDETEEEKVEKVEEKENKLESVTIDEVEVLKFQLINSQFNLVKKSLEALEIQRQVYLLEQNTVIENFNNFKKDIKEKYLVDFDNYTLDNEKRKLLKKDEKSKSKK